MACSIRVTELGANQPLRNDPARGAVASMAGYAGQISRSVLIWLRLENGERLYLEGAEDIDVIHGSAAETIQVKATKENITLRSPDVVEAIDNAWLNQQRARAVTRHLFNRAAADATSGTAIKQVLLLPQ